MKEALISLGVPVFGGSPTPLPLSGLIQDESLLVSDAIQQVVIEVDEKGTTAAAATALIMAAGTSAPEPRKPFRMICDRPFVFILYGGTYEGGAQILFTGVVNQP